jgi:hypothetical protein
VTQVYLAVLAPEPPVPWTHALVAKKRIINSWWQAGPRTRSAVNQAGQWALPGGDCKADEDPEQAALREFKEEIGVELDADFAAAKQADLAAERAAAIKATLSAPGGATAMIAQIAAMKARLSGAAAPVAAPVVAAPVAAAPVAAPVAAPMAPPKRVRVDTFGPPWPMANYHLVVLRVSADRQQKIMTSGNVQLAPATVTPARTGPSGGKAPTSLGRGDPSARSAYARPAGSPQRPPPGPDRLPDGQPLGFFILDWEVSELSLVTRVALPAHLGVRVALPPLHSDDLTLVHKAEPHTQDITWYAEMAAHLTNKHA